MRRTVFCFFGLLLSIACEIDDRTLKPIEWTITDAGTSADSDGCGKAASGSCNRGGASSGTVAVGGTRVGSNSNALAAGEAGAAPNTVAGPCNDLNGNSVVDRNETLAKNSTFDLESDRWIPENGVSLVWNPLDVCASQASGSLNLTYQKAGSTIGLPSASCIQCIPAEPGRTYSASASFFLQSAGSQASVGLVYYPTVDCTGDKISAGSSGTLTEIGVWTSATAMATAPANAGSFAVMLSAGRSDWKATQSQADILVDGVLATSLP